MTRTAARTAKQTPFEILGVSVADDAATIRAAWKRLVKANHPDRCPADAARLTAKLVELNDAYDKLKNHVPFHGARPAAPDFSAAAAQAEAARAAAHAQAHARAHAQAQAEAKAKARADAESARRKAEADARAVAKARAAAAEAARRAAEIAARKANPLSAKQRAALATANRAFANARAALDAQQGYGFARAA
ncbi:J domain-containing protein [Sagittula sp. S175]|uniref:J domain-containing protein n=1 Tax=Sagittula sp. S175 TaxID=3415129 RepID=UPI003C7D0985